MGKRPSILLFCLVLTAQPLVGSLAPVVASSGPHQPPLSAASATGQIAFVSDRDGNDEIYVMDVDGSHQTNLTHNPADDDAPTWSPDGQSLAFNTYRSGNWDIYVMAADGSNQRRLTDNPAVDAMPRWSPDGQKIAFVSDRDGNHEIYVMNANGSSQRRLTFGATSDPNSWAGSPAWSPDGQRIAFDRNGDIYVMGADGTNQTNLTHNSGLLYFDPAWSPDGERIAYDVGGGGIMVMKPDGMGQTWLTDACDGRPSWSPDGHRICFMSYGAECGGGDISDIYVMNADGSNRTQLTRNQGKNHSASWGPSNAKPWLLMYYLAEDNDITSPQKERSWVLTGQYTLLREASNNPMVNVVAFADSRTAPARYVVFSPYGGTSIVKGELSTGSPDTLRDFVLWAQQNYPASHYALVIVDHGQGHTGVAQDEDAPGDIADCRTPSGESVPCLTLKELRQALSSPVSKLDIVEMHACTMATIEAAYQLLGLADYYVASEDTLWISIMPNWLALGHRGRVGARDVTVPAITNSTSPEQLAVAMARSYYLNVNDGGLPGTISVARLANLPDVVTKTSALASLLKGQMSSLHNTVDGIKADVQYFDSNDDEHRDSKDEIVDLYHFAQLVESRVSQSDIKSAARQLMGAIGSYIVNDGSYERSWGAGQWHVENAHGVSIFFPNYSRSFYKGSWLDFAAGTTWNIAAMPPAEALDTTIEWGPMLVEYVRQTNPNVPDNPNPPALIAPLIPATIHLPLVVRDSSRAVPFSRNPN